jgi:hypothetical protein
MEGRAEGRYGGFPTSWVTLLVSPRWVPLAACNALILAMAMIMYAAVFVDVEINPCIITYMYPNYYRIQRDNFSRFENKYELYLYKEGPHVGKEVLALASTYPTQHTPL